MNNEGNLYYDLNEKTISDQSYKKTFICQNSVSDSLDSLWRHKQTLFVVVAASEGADEVYGVADALLPLAGDVHARVAVSHDQERRGR